MARRSYDVRTRRNTAGARTLAKVFSEPPVFIEDRDGYRVRQWRPEEMQTYTTDDLNHALRGKRAFEHNEMLEWIPPSAVKYACTKGWLRVFDGLYYVTEKGANELRLPRKNADGMKIKFARF